MDERPERSGVPGTLAHRAHLRAVLDGEDERLLEAASAPGLTLEQKDRVHRLIDEVYREPSVTPREVIELLEGLLSSPDLGPEVVYERLEERQTILTYRIALRAFQLGLCTGTGQPTET